MSDDVLVLRDFASPAEVATLLSALTVEAALAGARKALLGYRTVVEVSEELNDVFDPTFVEQVIAIRDRAVGTLCEHLAGDTSHCHDLTLLVEIKENDYYPLHADAERETPDGWVPNHCPWRSLSGILYLGTSGVDFQGGELSLPNVGLTIPPEAGMLVGFTATRRHMHGVSKVTAGRRRTMPVWLRHENFRGVRMNGT